jgi:hypothetical protein
VKVENQVKMPPYCAVQRLERAEFDHDKVFAPLGESPQVEAGA